MVLNLRRHRRKEYSVLRRARPELFKNSRLAATEILFRKAKQRRVAREVRREMRKLKIPTAYADVGVIYEDQYVKLVRDAVRFRSGECGSYIRILPAALSVGVAVLPLHEGRIVLISHFRHSTRNWHWEIPRGFAEPGEKPEETAAREMKEELDVGITRMERLGLIHPDTGLLTYSVPLYAAIVDRPPIPEGSEGIDDVRVVTLSEAEVMIESEEITDSFTLAALCLLRSRGGASADLGLRLHSQ
ncbi:NUDIX hydrolase [Streptomyces sp. NBC_00267]|uniref:NUDIX hydrolase n=1 Tax=unclassified Streptomyces TaxID=2593676 RepID=UPI003FA7BEB7